MQATLPPPSKPGSQTQAIAPTFEDDLAAHCEHAVAPVVFTYLPTVHPSQSTAADMLVYLPATHAVQADLSVDIPARALPAAHAQQCARPSPSKPGRQAHDLPSAVEVALVAH